jgi:hypothetical protein
MLQVRPFVCCTVISAHDCVACMSTDAATEAGTELVAERSSRPDSFSSSGHSSVEDSTNRGDASVASDVMLTRLSFDDGAQSCNVSNLHG